MEPINKKIDDKNPEEVEKNQLKLWLLNSITNKSLHTSRSMFLESICNSFDKIQSIYEGDTPKQKVNIP